MNEIPNHTHYPDLQTKTRHMQTNYSCFCYLPLNHFNMITAYKVYTHSAVSATEGRAPHFLLPGLRGYSDARRHAPFPDVLGNLVHILI